MIDHKTRMSETFDQVHCTSVEALKRFGHTFEDGLALEPGHITHARNARNRIDLAHDTGRENNPLEVY